MTVLSRGTGLIQASRTHSIYHRRTARFSRQATGIIYVPGLTGNELSWDPTYGTEVGQSWRACAEYRFRICSMEELIEWGNDTIQQRITDLYTYAQANWGYSPNRVHLFAASGGTPTVLNWARHNQSLVASIALVIPAVDPQSIENNKAVELIWGAGSNSTYGPNVAYGGSPTIPDAYNPTKNAGEYGGIPIRIWYSPNDQIIIPSTVTTFAAASGAGLTLLPTQTGLGHSSVGMKAGDVLSFFKANP